MIPIDERNKSAIEMLVKDCLPHPTGNWTIPGRLFNPAVHKQVGAYRGDFVQITGDSATPEVKRELARLLELLASSALDAAFSFEPDPALGVSNFCEELKKRYRVP